MSDQFPHEDSSTLAIKNIIISRMDGIREGYRVDSLSPGINLIHGPNGIGKSRTAQALQALIWPGPNVNRASIVGNLNVASDAWNVELESGKAAYQRNSASVPGFSFVIPPDSHRDRYLLTLQDMLRVENRDFALEIQKQAAGGYDLEEVRSKMGIPLTEKRYRPSKPDKPLRDIRNELHALRQHDEALRIQEHSLGQLKDQHQRAVTATNRLVELENASTYRRACEDLAAGRLTLESFSEPVQRMIGKELEQVAKLQQDLDLETEKQRKLSADVSAYTDEIHTTGLAGNIPSVSVISGLRNRLKDLREHESILQRIEGDIKGHVDALSALRNRLTRDLTEEQMENLDATGLRDLAKLSLEWQQAQNSLRNQNDLQEWLGSPIEWDRESLRSGMDLLSRYYRTQNAGTEATRSRLIVISLFGAAVLIVVAAVLLATSLSQYSLLLAIATLPLLWVAFTSKSDAREKELNQIQSQYSSLGLAVPASWTADEVFRSLHDIQEMVAKAELEHQRAMRWSDLQVKRQQNAVEVQALEERRANYTEKYGIDLAETVPQCLDALAKALEEWRRELSLLTKATSQRTTLEAQRMSVLATIKSELRLYRVQPEIHDSTSAHAAIEDLDHRINAANRASDSLRHARERVENDVTPRIHQIQEQLAAVYTDFGLEPNDLPGLKRLCDQVEPYTAARNAVNTAEVVVTNARARLRPGSGDENLDQDAIERAIATEVALANQRDSLQADISRIETEIDSARHQTRIESTLARERAALEVLAEGRQQDYASAADRLVFGLIQNRHREVNRPAVFRIADDLFMSFTNGAYQLGLDEENSEFTAIDADTGQSLALDKLSSGTRVQLLLAIRLAFVEVSEQGLQLPLIMDETLGNTDDIRAKSIIDATIEIARRGRQVMYFTAQHDEIGKWSAALESLDNPLEWNVFDLANIRGRASAKPVEAYSWDYSTFTSVSVPEGMDWYSLREHLGVPPIDIQTTSVTEVDLWYLVPEESTLVELRQRGVQRWGQCLNLHHGNHLRGIWSEQTHNKAFARAQVIEQFCNAWREGRPVPLTADDLRESTIISERFWDELVQCAEQNSWDGRAFISAIGEGAIKGFRRAAFDQLNEWLSDNGFISQSQPLDDAVIRARVISSLNDAIEKEIIDIHEIDELIRQLVGQPVSAKQAS